MKPHVSSYERGRNIVRVLVVLAIVLGVSALMFTQENSREQMALVIASAACVVGVIVVARFLCVCPHCGKRIVSGVLVLRVCPKCKHDLLTGAKVKTRDKNRAFSWREHRKTLTFSEISIQYNVLCLLR